MSALRLRSVIGARRGPESVFSGPRVRIGRSRDNDLILPDKDDPAAGSHHAEALLDSRGTWWIVDGRSANGTLLNGAAISRHAIKNGDRLTFGDEQFLVAIGGVGTRAWLGILLLALIAAGALAFAALVVVQRLDRARAAPFEGVAAAAARSVFLIAIDDGAVRTPLGTGFVIEQTAQDDRLVTNAHVAAQLQSRAVFSNSSTLRAVAVEGDTYASWQIVDATIHPGWHAGSIENDVAVLGLQRAALAGRGPALTPLALADAATMARITRGTPVAAFGFPAVSTDAQRPRGRLSVDVVGDVRGDYLESGLSIAPGTSGSPVFDQAGLVIGIVAGGDFVGGPGEPPRPSGSSVNWVLSASVIREVIR